MFYVRKIEKPKNLQKLQTHGIGIPTHIIQQEFKTDKDTLSFWECEDLNKLSDVYKNIILSGSDIKPIQFIILEDTILKNHNLEMKNSIGKTGYRGHEKLHFDMVNLTHEKLGELLRAYTSTTKNHELTPYIDLDQVTKYIQEVIDLNQLNETSINDHLKAVMNDRWKNLNLKIDDSKKCKDCEYYNYFNYLKTNQSTPTL